jgi:hypothetical protein
MISRNNGHYRFNHDSSLYAIGFQDGCKIILVNIPLYVGNITFVNFDPVEGLFPSLFFFYKDAKEELDNILSDSTYVLHNNNTISSIIEEKNESTIYTKENLKIFKLEPKLYSEEENKDEDSNNG